MKELEKQKKYHVSQVAATMEIENGCQKLEQIVKVFASYYADPNDLHPFREGNGRSQREFCRKLCLQFGYTFDLRHTDHNEMVAASIDSLEKGDNIVLEAIFRKCVLPLSILP